MAKIKTVTYERLYSLSNYNNEKISFTATVDDGENQDIVLGQLFHKAMEVHKFFAYYRSVFQDVDRVCGRVHDYEVRIINIEREIENQKVTIAELAESLKKGEVTEKMRHACAGHL